MDVVSIISQVLTFLINPIFEIIYWIISLIPKIPDFPSSVYQNFKNFLDYVFSSNGLGFVGWFFGGWTVPLLIISIGVFVSISRFAYLLIMFVITKLPIGVKR